MHFFSDLLLLLLYVSSEKRCLEIIDIHFKAPRIRNNIITKLPAKRTEKNCCNSTC